MKTAILLLLPSIGFAASLPPTPFPVFLRAGFSSVLEFDEIPSKVVLGDPQKFQVERLDKSLVIKTLAAYASTNLFVYFNAKEPRLFVLTASEDAQPTFYKSFEPPPEPPKEVPKPKPPLKSPSATTEGRVLSARFDAKKDYLTVEIDIGAASSEPLHPAWNGMRLKFQNIAIAPTKLWAERKVVQKDARVKARAIFAKPNVPRNLSGVTLIIPLDGHFNPIRLSLSGGIR